MHRPERWGFVLFTDERTDRLPESVRSELPVRDALMNVYHRQRAFQRENKRWAKSLRELGITDDALSLNGDGANWTARMPLGDRTFVVRSDSRLWSE